MGEYSHVGLLGEFDFLDALEGSNHVLVLDTHNTATPVSAELLVVVELFTELLGEVFQILEVFLVNFGEGDSGSSLHVDELSKSGLAADESVWNILSSAESWKVDNSFDWVNIVSNDDKFCLTLLNKSGHVVETELDVDWLGGLASTSLLGGGLEAELLLLLGLWLVLGEELEKLIG